MLRIVVEQEFATVTSGFGAQEFSAATTASSDDTNAVDAPPAEIFGPVAVNPLNPGQGELSSKSTRTSMPVNRAGGPN